MAKITLGNIGQLLRDGRGDRGIREVAREMSISPATLSRVENGKLPDLETFSKICKWLRIDPGEVLGLKTAVHVPTSSERSVTEMIVAAHLRADKTQSPEAAQALAEMILAAQRIISESPRR